MVRSTIIARTIITMDGFSKKMLQLIVEKLHSILALIAIDSVANLFHPLAAKEQINTTAATNFDTSLDEIHSTVEVAATANFSTITDYDFVVTIVRGNNSTISLPR